MGTDGSASARSRPSETKADVETNERQDVDQSGEMTTRSRVGASGCTCTSSKKRIKTIRVCVGVWVGVYGCVGGRVCVCRCVCRCVCMCVCRCVCMYVCMCAYLGSRMTHNERTGGEANVPLWERTHCVRARALMDSVFSSATHARTLAHTTPSSSSCHHTITVLFSCHSLALFLYVCLPCRAVSRRALLSCSSVAARSSCCRSAIMIVRLTHRTVRCDRCVAANYHIRHRAVTVVAY